MKKYLLALILILALVLRTWNLGQIPEAIDEDEMALGYYAYSLMVNGSDEYGERFPIYFESIGDYKYGVYSYFAVPSVALLGLNPFSARLPAAIAGSLTCLVVFYLSSEIFKKRKHAYLSALLLAISPTHIHFSRVAYNNTLGLLLASLSILFFIRYLKKSNAKALLITLIAFVLSIYSYQAFRIFLPAMFALISIISKQKKAAFIAVLIIIISAISLIPKQSRVRSQKLDLLVGAAKITEQASEDNYFGINLYLTRGLHNKVVTGSLEFTNRYLDYFNPNFLFLKTTENVSRHSTADIGLLYLIELPLLLLAIYYYSRFSKSKYKFIPLAWILASPLAAVFVVGPPNTTRSLMSLVGFALIVPVGIIYIKKIIPEIYSNYVYVVLLFAYIANFVFFSHQYWVHKRIHQPWHSDVGLKQMVNTVTENYYDKYDKIVVSGGHYIPFLFYNKIHPNEFISKAKFEDKSKQAWNRVEGYDKLVFNMPYSCPPAGKLNVLYVCFDTKAPINGEVVEVIRYRDNLPAILLIEFKPISEIDEDRDLPERVEINNQVNENYPQNIIPEDKDLYW